MLNKLEQSWHLFVKIVTVPYIFGMNLYKLFVLFQVSRLDSEVTKLRAQLEKGEAVRQNLEYELSKARRDINKEKRNVSERDTLLTEVNDTMKRKHALTEILRFY